MKIRITKNHVDALCVLIGVLGMGSLYFQVLRMPLMAAMLIASILLLTRAHHPKISAQNVRLTLLLTAALLLLAAGCALTAKEMKAAARRDEKRRNTDGSEDRAACGF